ncbi:MAG: alpha/beta hydrolase [Oceanospirillaceae bacterium]|nr:alpha/beta hydrolase [Oceanospirillaceae bacterium]
MPKKVTYVLNNHQIIINMEQPVVYREYGDKDGELVVYFYSAPGAMEECVVFDRYAKDHNLHIVCFDRFALDSSLSREDYFHHLATQIDKMAGGKQVAIVGFSIGTYIALEVAALLKEQVRQIYLVSSVAPLYSGDFLDHMAGGLVFKLAMRKPSIFSLLTQFQSMIARLAPSMLVNMLFATAAGKDKELIQQSDFKKHIIGVLKQCFKYRAKGYIRDITYYVKWREQKEYNTSIQLWHGTEDNWSPPAMADSLANTITSNVSAENMKELSHYSCLDEAAPKICTQLSKG